MPPRNVSSTSTAMAASNTQRPNAQPPKSPGKQASACAPCRTRGLRCDLQDLPPSNSLCSNCIQSGLDYAGGCVEIKSIKRHRRGRRARQVEAIYGKIPALQPEFFTSKFWTWFCIQHPVLDPNEFSQRYIAHVEGKNAIGPEGVIIAMLLVVWAASFGLDEFGSPIKHHDSFTNSDMQLTIDFNSHEVISASSSHNEPSQDGKYRCKQNISVMLMQILELIGMCGILRRPTLDGVRVLLLVVPLMEDNPYLEKAVIHEAAFSHTRILRAASSTLEESDTFTRIFLYGHVQGITTTLKCGHPVFRSGDIDTLRNMISLLTDKPATSTASLSKVGNQMMQLILVPLRLGSVCCKFLSVIVSLKAMRQVEEHNVVKSNGMREIWQDLEQCWHELLSIKSDTIAESEKDSIEHLADAWLIFIFECYNWILESLKRLAFGVDPHEHSPHTLSKLSSYTPSPVSQSSTSSPSLPLSQLYLEARMRCVQLLPRVLRIIRYHLKKCGGSSDMPGLFAWDAGLVRDGCFYAGLLAADLYNDIQCLGGHDSEDQGEESEDCIAPEEGVNLILSALAEMHWVFSKSEERSETIRLALHHSREKLQNTKLVAVHNQCSMVMASVTGAADPGVAFPTPQQGEPAPYTRRGTRSDGWTDYTPFAAASFSSQGPFLSPYECSQVEHQAALHDSRDAQVAVEIGSYCLISDSFTPNTLFPTINDSVDYVATSLPDTCV